MSKKTRQMALCGMLCALSVVVMMMGGLIPLATYCCPVLVGILFIPIVMECGTKLGLAAYIAVALLSVLMGPDKEAAFLVVFFGYYPLLKPRLQKIPARPLRLALKLALFNAAIGVMYAFLLFVLHMEDIAADYQSATRIMTAAMVLLANFTMLVYDRALDVFALYYVKKVRPRLMRGAR